MRSDNLNQAIQFLNQSDQFRVISKYQRPEFYNMDDNASKLTGVFLDIETTGLSCTKDRLIELGMVKFEYSEDGRIFRILDEFNAYQDPCRNIPEIITQLTGITDDMVKGHHISEAAVANYLDKVDLIVAHNAQFDRGFFETTFPAIKPKRWACSLQDVAWSKEKIESHKLEYIAYKYNFFYEGHRAVIDCLVGIHVLTQSLFTSKQLVFKQLLENALQPRFRIWAKNADYGQKDNLRERKYKWEAHPIYNFKSWVTEVPENKVEAEINYLKSEIYKGQISLPVEVFDAYSRFSINNQLLPNDSKYQGKLEWVKALQGCR